MRRSSRTAPRRHGHPAGAPTQPANRRIAVQFLTGKSSKQNNGWRAYATVTILDYDSRTVVPNVTVSGSFVPGGTASCVTAISGSCTMSSARLNNGTTSTVMAVSNATGTNMTYEVSQNTITQITISKP